MDQPRLEASQSVAKVDSSPTPALSLERRAEAGARGLADLAEREHRVPTLVEIKATISRFIGHAGSLSVREGDALVRALHGLHGSDESTRREQGTLREITEVVFHHYPNSFNASPS